MYVCAVGGCHPFEQKRCHPLEQKKKPNRVEPVKMQGLSTNHSRSQGADLLSPSRAPFPLPAKWKRGGTRCVEKRPSRRAPPACARRP